MCVCVCVSECVYVCVCECYLLEAREHLDKAVSVCVWHVLMLRFCK